MITPSQELAAEGSAARGDEHRLRPHLLFQILDQWLALPIQQVEEIIGLGWITPLPRLPAHVPGVVLERGRAIPVLDLACFLSFAPIDQPSGEQERLVVVSFEVMRVGLVCRRVAGIEIFHEKDLAEPEAIASNLRPFATAQIKNPRGLVAVLDLGPLLEAARPRV